MVSEQKIHAHVVALKHIGNVHDVNQVKTYINAYS